MIDQAKLSHSATFLNTTLDTRLFQFFILIFTPVILVACGGDDDDDVFVPYEYAMPEQTGDGWQVGQLQDVGIDATRITEVMNFIRRKEPGFRFIDSLVIIKNGQLVFDELIRTRFDRFDNSIGNRNIELHTLRSATKSFASTLVGIAIYQSYIPGADILVHDYLQQRQPIANWDTSKQSIKMSDWLTMRHGYEWEEDDFAYFDLNTITGQFENASDPFQFVLDLPMANSPGQVYEYNTGVSYALGRFVQEITGQHVIDFIDSNLFQPLNISVYEYSALAGELHTGAGLYLSARDMAKLGQLYLNGGVWNGYRIISEDWVNLATQSHVEFDTGHDGYGYQWWTHDFEYDGGFVTSFRAQGFGGQYIIVIPNLELVVVLTSHAYTEEQIQERGQIRIVQDYILPSIM